MTSSQELYDTLLKVYKSYMDDYCKIIDHLQALCNSYKNDYDRAFERLKSQQQEIDRLRQKLKEYENENE